MRYEIFCDLGRGLFDIDRLLGGEVARQLRQPVQLLRDDHLRQYLSPPTNQGLPIQPTAGLCNAVQGDTALRLMCKHGPYTMDHDIHAVLWTSVAMAMARGRRDDVELHGFFSDDVITAYELEELYTEFELDSLIKSLLPRGASGFSVEGLCHLSSFDVAFMDQRINVNPETEFWFISNKNETLAQLQVLSSTWPDLVKVLNTQIPQDIEVLGDALNSLINEFKGEVVDDDTII